MSPMPEDAPGDALGIESLDRLHLLAQADEADRLAGDGAHRQRRPAAPVAVHPGQDDARHADLVVEFGGDIDRVLTGQAVDHQQRLARVGDVAHRSGLRDQLGIDMQPAGRVQHVDIVAAQAGLRLGASGDRDRVLALDDGQRVDADLAAEHGELVHRGGAVGVERRHQHLLALALGEPLGELGGGGGLARALQADHQDGCWRVVDLEAAGIVLAAQRLDERVMHDLDDLLTGGDRSGDRLTGGLFLDPLDEVAGDGQRDVRLQKRDAHLAQRGPHVVLGERPLPREPVEHAGEALGQVFEHRSRSNRPVAV